jgi:hypothetical protein
MHVLAIDRIRDGVAIDRELDPLVHEELRVLWQLYLDGTVTGFHARADVRGTVLVLDVSDLEAAAAAVARFPAYREGLTEFQIIPLQPFADLRLLFAERLTADDMR